MNDSEIEGERRPRPLSPTAPKVLPDPAEAEDADEELVRASRILANLGFCGHYMHFRRGGRSGRAPILCLLSKNHGVMPQQALGAHFDIRPGSLSEILSKMETSGLIKRTRDPKDRRQLTVELTNMGIEAARLENERRLRFRHRAFDNLSAEEQEALAALLDRVRTRWEDMDA